MATPECTAERLREHRKGANCKSLASITTRAAQVVQDFGTGSLVLSSLASSAVLGSLGTAVPRLIGAAVDHLSAVRQRVQERASVPLPENFRGKV
jgi:hypothetical protein